MERNVKVYKFCKDMESANVFLDAHDDDRLPVIYEGDYGLRKFLELVGSKDGFECSYGERVTAVGHEFMTVEDLIGDVDYQGLKYVFCLNVKSFGNMSFFRFIRSLDECINHKSVMVTSEGYRGKFLAELRYLSYAKRDMLSVERIIPAMEGKDEYGLYVKDIKEDVLNFLSTFYFGMEFDEDRVNMLFKYEYDGLVRDGEKMYGKVCKQD
jgi:hypothetical protein